VPESQATEGNGELTEAAAAPGDPPWQQLQCGEAKEREEPEAEEVMASPSWTMGVSLDSSMPAAMVLVGASFESSGAEGLAADTPPTAAAALSDERAPTARRALCR
jgi:hypothetical protein